MVHGQIVALRPRSKCNGRKIGLPAIVLRAANELNDFCAHENPSHTAMATSPTNASDIKYAVMFASLQKIRHCRAWSGNPSERCILQRLMDARIIPDQVGDRRPGVTKIESARSGSNMRQIALCDHFRREPYPFPRDRHGRSPRRGRPRTWTWPRRAPARSRVPANA
jgi:hypothetical protein